MKQPKKQPSKNWKYYLLELLVVFVGVTGAFLLNTWRENRIARTQVNNYMESLRADLREDQETLKENIEFLTSNNRMLRKFTEYPGEDWTTDSTRLVLYNSFQLVSFRGKSSTYESMKYSGHLTLISDFDTRTAIVGYYEAFPTIALMDDLALEWTTAQILETYLDKIDFRTLEVIDSSIFNELSFLNRLSGLWALLNQNLSAYTELLEENKILLNLLEA